MWHVTVNAMFCSLLNFLGGAHDETWQQVQKQQVQKFKTEK